MSACTRSIHIASTFAPSWICTPARSSFSAPCSGISKTADGCWEPVLPKSLYIQRQQLHAEHVADGHELTLTDACAVRPDTHPELLEAARQLEDVARLQCGELTQRQRQASQLEVEADGDVVRRACRSCI